jgi:hypothetical protein
MNSEEWTASRIVESAQQIAMFSLGDIDIYASRNSFDEKQKVIFLQAYSDYIQAYTEVQERKMLKAEQR